ncbi:sigma-70 family RNA polymerase sigma factor [bacterium]|nr:sigma-70 family RNA polymerase sigma factor [bacterium]
MTEPNTQPPRPAGPEREEILAELLVLRFRRGDSRAFREIVERWEKRLFYYLRRLCGQEQESWDLLQQTWLKALRGLGGLREPRKLNAWLYTLARRSAADRIAALAAENSRRADEAVLDEIADDSPGPEEFADAALVHWGLDKLELPQREILTLFFLEDFSLAEVAEILELPLGTVKSRLHRARSALREVLSREGGLR